MQRAQLVATLVVATLKRLLVLAVLVAVAVIMLRPQVGGGPGPPRSQCKNNLKQFGLAFQNYHEAFGSFPPAVVHDASGRAVHSWRTALLPYLELAPLFDSYRWQEPWNGSGNNKLLTSNVEVFSCPEPPIDKHPPNTSYLAIVGANTAWRSDGTTVRLSDITDDHSSTILLVEVQNSGIHIFEPRDLSIDQMPLTINPKSGQGISSRHYPGGANALMVDGTVKWLTNDLSPDVLHAMLTINGGEKIIEDSSRNLRLDQSSPIASNPQAR